jgi:hypothetical protein
MVILSSRAGQIVQGSHYSIPQFGFVAFESGKLGRLRLKLINMFSIFLDLMQPFCSSPNLDATFDKPNAQSPTDGHRAVFLGNAVRFKYSQVCRPTKRAD